MPNDLETENPNTTAFCMFAPCYALYPCVPCYDLDQTTRNDNSSCNTTAFYTFAPSLYPPTPYLIFNKLCTTTTEQFM